MGIFDFLGDLSSKRSKELGLGGLQSLLGTRGAAQAGAIGDEMIGITNKDSLPGYFNEQTREYVPWYVDLFDGGGLNAAGGVAQQEAAMSKAAAAGITPGGAPMAQPGLLANNQLSDMERANRSRVGVDPRNLGGSEGYGQTGVSPLNPFGGAGPTIPAPRTPELPRVREIQSDLVKLDGGELLNKDLNRLDYYHRNMEFRENLRDNPPNIAMPKEPIVFSSDPAQVGSQAIPASGGNMAINTPAAQNRDQMIADQQAYVHEQKIKSHPLYPQYVDFLNRSKLPNDPGLFEKYLRIVVGSN